MKRLTLELGGNDAAIVLDDVDPIEVAPKLFVAATMNAGQLCLGAKRLYVHDSQYDRICAELGRLARESVVDDGLKQGTQIGPLQNKAQFEKVKGFLEDARQNGKIVATYDYTDNKGDLLYQVLRYEPKTFRQRRPDGKGGWIKNVEGCGRVLYRLPELLKYPDAGVFVCEGEKDADRVASLDHCATTVACGVLGWKNCERGNPHGRLASDSAESHRSW